MTTAEVTRRERMPWLLAGPALLLDVRRGGTLVTARVDDAAASKLEGVLDRSSLRTSDVRSAYSKTGWKSFDPASKPLSADEVRQNRSMYQ